MAKSTRGTSPEVAEPAPGLFSSGIRVGDIVRVSGATARAGIPPTPPAGCP